MIPGNYFIFPRIIFFVNSYHHEKLYASTEADKGLKSSYRPNEGIFRNPLILNLDLIEAKQGPTGQC